MMNQWAVLTSESNEKVQDEMQSLDLPALEDALEDVEFFERERTDSFVVELPIVLYNIFENPAD